jgi:hypothetical protein
VTSASGPDPHEVDRVLRAFTREGRIVSLPARWSKKLVLLDVVAQSFEPGRAYAETEVNAILREWYEHDWVSLRRYLVDAGMLDRRDGWYWRIGGSFEP